jgi:hypothetical protein
VLTLAINAREYSSAGNFQNKCGKRTKTLAQNQAGNIKSSKRFLFKSL